MAVPLWDYGICYYPAPKVANTSVKHALFEMQNGTVFTGEQLPSGKTKHIHKIYKTPHFREVDHYSYANLIRFTIVRDPIDRVVSAWRNRVKFHGELNLNRISEKTFAKYDLIPSPDLNTFVERIGSYRRISTSIKTHTDPLINFLGEDPGYFHLIFEIHQMEQLQTFLSIISGRDVRIPRDQAGGPKANRDCLTADNLDKLKKMYQGDYDVFGNALQGHLCGVPKEIRNSGILRNKINELASFFTRLSAAKRL